MKKLPLLFASTVAMMNLAHAATIVWDGGAGAFTDANWTLDGTPSQNHTSFAGNTHTTTIGSGSVSGFSQANTGDIDAADSITISGGAAVTGDFIRVNGGSPTIIMLDGSLTLGNANALRANNAFGGEINFTGVAGAATYVQTDNTNALASLAGKVSLNATSSYFSIDGTEVNTAITYDGTNLAAINADLAGTVIGGRFFQITEAGGTQTLGLVAVPEPSSTALLGLGGLALILRRRK